MKKIQITRERNYIELDNDSLFKTMFFDKKSRRMVAAVLNRITGINEEKNIQS